MSDENKLDVLGMGNAMVDILANVTDEFLIENDVQKDAMNLVDAERSKYLYERIDVKKETSGGSLANSIHGLAKLGIKSGFIGKVTDDADGKIFSDDIRAAGVEYTTRYLPNDKGISTSKCIILLTPDATRSMNTYLGASGYITPFDVDEDMISRAEITYLEGYLFDKPEAKKAFKMIAEIAHKERKKIALTLSDKFCVERHHNDFAELIENYVDILFCNEDEIKALCKTEELPKTLPNCELIVITRGKKGAVIVSRNEYIEVAAEEGVKVVDLTGAGDGFAAGFLYGYVKKLPLEKCGKIAVAVASEVISQMGPRVEKDLLKVLKKKGLIEE